MSKELDGKMKKLMAQSKRDWETKKLPAINKRLEEEAKKTKLDAEKRQHLVMPYRGEEKIVVTMTDEQIENWRKILCRGILGPFALIMPKEEIQKIRDGMQAEVNTLDEKLKVEGEGDV